MKFINYCVIIMGKTNGCKTEIVKIAEDTPKFLEAKGVTIATFMSVAEPGEITEYFKTYGRNFLIFNLDKDVSGFNLTDKKIEELLFGHMYDNSQDDKTENSNTLSDRTNRLLDDINRTDTDIQLKSQNIKAERKYVINNDMSKVEMTEIMNKILDKGSDNFTEYDKKTLTELSERTAKMK